MIGYRRISQDTGRSSVHPHLPGRGKNSIIHKFVKLGRTVRLAMVLIVCTSSRWQYIFMIPSYLFCFIWVPITPDEPDNPKVMVGMFMGNEHIMDILMI